MMLLGIVKPRLRKWGPFWAACGERTFALGASAPEAFSKLLAGQDYPYALCTKTPIGLNRTEKP